MCGWLREGIFKEQRAGKLSASPRPPLLNARGGERPEREGGTWVDRPLRDPPQQLSPEQSGQEEFKLRFLPGEIISALHENPPSAQGTQIASCSDGCCSVVQQQLSETGVCEGAGKRGASVCPPPPRPVFDTAFF